MLPSKIYEADERLSSTPDGIDNFIGALVEFKCPFSRKIPEEVPVHYLIQVQGQMAIWDAPACDLVYWTPDDFRIFPVMRDPDLWEKIYRELCLFLDLTEPPPRGYKAILQLEEVTS